MLTYLAFTSEAGKLAESLSSPKNGGGGALHWESCGLRLGDLLHATHWTGQDRSRSRSRIGLET